MDRLTKGILFGLLISIILWMLIILFLLISIWGLSHREDGVKRDVHKMLTFQTREEMAQTRQWADPAGPLFFRVR